MFITSVAQTEGAASGETTGGTDTFFLDDFALGAFTADQTTAQTQKFEFPLNITLQTGKSIVACQHVAMANAVRWCVHIFGGDY
jgi:hypothetical protein